MYRVHLKMESSKVLLRLYMAMEISKRYHSMMIKEVGKELNFTHQEEYLLVIGKMMLYMGQEL